jgi:hypothetical protein
VLTRALRQVAPSEVFLSSLGGRQVILFFYPSLAQRTGQLNLRQRALAQGLLVEALDASYAMGFVDALATAAWNAMVKDPTKSWEVIRGIAVDFCKKALPHWFRHATAQDLRDPRIYESARVAVARQFRGVVETEIGAGGVNDWQ